ncbi:MAG TPA: hypothetical protein VEL03_10350, partial [Streptosporangiaceae bacterium]|nr:hypothetical protein [Streptosporangiaceae bacterium]
ALAVVAVAASVAVPGVILSGNTGHSQASGSPSSSAARSVKRPAMPASAPETFNVLVPYAAFGWLPAGYSEANISLSDFGLLNSGPTEVDRTAVAASGAMVSLAVDARGVCTGKPDSCAPGTPSAKAPDVNGRPAWWTLDGHGIAWEYAPGAWADVRVMAASPAGAAALAGLRAARSRHDQPAHGTAPVRGTTVDGRAAWQTPASAATRHLILRIADAVKYAQRTPLLFDVQLAGPLPAGWTLQLQQMGFHVVDGRLLADGLTVGPAADNSALSISATKPLGYGCNYVSGQSSYVTEYGVSWEYRVLDDHVAKNVEMLCSMQPIDGLDVNIYLDMAPETAGAAPLPGSYQLGGAFGVYTRLRLLGLKPANWTTDPLG